MFQAYMNRYLKAEALSFRESLRIGFQPIFEAEDDELNTAIGGKTGSVSIPIGDSTVAYALGALKY